MRRLLALIALSALAGEASADPAVLTVTPTAEGVRVEYRLDAPTDRFVFETPLSAEARATPIEPGLNFTREAVMASAPVSAFSLDLRPDRVRVDATYPVLTRVGEGWMIHLASLQGEGEPGEVVIAPGPGWAVVAGPGEQPMDGFIYLGPAVPEAGQGVRAIIDPAVPAWLAEDAAAALESSNAFYARGLAIPAPGQPVLIVGALPAEDRAAFVGDVTPNQVINLQFAPRALPSEREPRIGDMVVPFVAHETFHVWQGDGFRDAPGVNGRWLTEGAAEYFSLLAQADQSPAAAERSRAVLARRLGACLAVMDKHPQGLVALTGAEAQATRYDCGTVSQWLADLQTRNEGGLFGVWRGLLARPDGYGVADFRTAIAGHPSAAQDALLDGDPDIRGVVIAGLGALGAQVDAADPGADAWAAAALWPLLQSHCSGQMGIMTENGRYTLDTSDRCGPLAGGHEAVSIDGHRFDAAGEAAYRAVETACAAAGTVAVGLIDGGVVREALTRCTRPAAPPAAAYRVARLP